MQLRKLKTPTPQMWLSIFASLTTSYLHALPCSFWPLMRCLKARQDFHVYQLTLLCFVGFAMERLPVRNCGSPALDLGSRKPDGWVEVRVRNFVYAWRQSKSCPRIQHLRKKHTTNLLDASFLCLVFLLLWPSKVLVEHSVYWRYCDCYSSHEYRN